MEYRQAKADEFFTKISSPPHNTFGGLSFLKRRHLRSDPSLIPHAFVQKENTFGASNSAKWKRVNRVVAGRIREIHLLWPEFLLLSLDGNCEILAKMIHITLSRITGDVPGQPLLQQQIGAGQVQPLAQPLVEPGTFLWNQRLAVMEDAKRGFMRTHVGIPGGLQMVEGPDGAFTTIDLPPAKANSSGEFLEIYEELNQIHETSIFPFLNDFKDICPYVWITFWLELTDQDCGPCSRFAGMLFKSFSGIPGTFGTFALMNKMGGERWGLLHKFLVKFEERNPSACLPGRIDSQEMNTFRDFLNGSEGGKDVIVQLIDFATEVIKLFNAKWKRLAEAFPASWYSAFYVRVKRILPADLRPFYEMFLMFSRTATRDILVQVVQHNEREIVSVDYDGVFTVNGTTRYGFVEPDDDDPENLPDEKLDSWVLEAVKDDKRRAILSENVEPNVLIRDGLWSFERSGVPEPELLAFFKKPKMQKLHLFGARDSGDRYCRMRLSKPSEEANGKQIDPDQKFPSQVIIERSDWSKDANVNTELILKALSAAYPTYTQVVNVIINGSQLSFDPQGFIYRQVLFLFKVNRTELHKHYASNTPIKILPDILLKGYITQSVTDYVAACKGNPTEPFTVRQDIDPQQFTALIRDLVTALDDGRIVWI